MAFSGLGSGTSGNPYQITTPAQLQEMNNNLSSYFKLMNNLDMAGFDYGDGCGFLPIGNSTTSFTGGFIGNYKNINNLYINRPFTDNVGLFGYNRNTLDANNIANFSVTNALVRGRNYTGILAGQANGNPNIYRIAVTGSVFGEVYTGG